MNSDISVQLRDGIEITLSTGEQIVLDGAKEDLTPVVSHAHGDHIVDGTTEIVASNLTAALTSVRQDRNIKSSSNPAVTLHDAGHIAGSRAIEITDQESGITYLYTGDYSTRDRFYLSGFDPIDADILITETTYGKPEYTFPPTKEVVREINDWLEATMDEVVILFGYALGRAQKLQRILAGSCRNTIYVTDAIADLNDVITSYCDVQFPAKRYSTETTLEEGDALVLPMQTSRLAWIESLIEKHDAITAGFSGWAVDDSFIYRRGLDRGFVLSDHCDYSELVDVVESVDPDQIYTYHGFSEEFATHLATEMGYSAQALKQNQSTLSDF